MIQLIPTMTGAEETRLAEHPVAHQALLLFLQQCSCLLWAKFGIRGAQYQDLEDVPKTAAFNFTELPGISAAHRGQPEEQFRRAPKKFTKTDM